MGSDWENKVNSWFVSGNDKHSLNLGRGEEGSGGKQAALRGGEIGILVSPREEKRNFDPGNYPDLVNDGGLVRLARARSLFLGDPGDLGFNTFEESLGFGETVFSYWRDQSEYLVLKKEYVGHRKDVDDQYLALKCSKRGNDVYQRRIKTRLGWLNREIPDRKFFEIKDFQVGKVVHTSLLWVTLTWDRKRSSLVHAWESLGKDFNRFISALRRKYGRISYLRVWESYESGYPHVHVVMLFHDTKFSVFPHYAPNQKGKLTLTFRIQEKEDVTTLWHSHVDIQAISSLSNVFTYLKKHQEKIILGLSGSIQEGEGDLTGFDLENVKGLRTLFLSWIFRLRSFSVSGDFRDRLLDLISHLHNSNMLKAQVDLFGNIVPEWIYHYIGVFSGERLGIPAVIWVKRFCMKEISWLLDQES